MLQGIWMEYDINGNYVTDMECLMPFANSQKLIWGKQMSLTLKMQNWNSSKQSFPYFKVFDLLQS